MLLDWIDKDLNEIISEDNFKNYFDNITPKQDDDVFYLTSSENGIEILLSKDKKVTSIHLFSNGLNKMKEFEGILPNKLSFLLNRQQVIDNLGKPNISGGGVSNILYGKVRPWDKYLFNKYSLRIEYSDSSDRILLVTCASKKLEQYLNTNYQ